VMHTNVAHIYFIGEDAGRLYFAMEYVTGETLADKTARGPLPAEQALTLIHDAVLGLREAQRSGFTHRDVKPSNLMVDGHGVVKVLDFGLAAGAPEHAEIAGPVAQTTMAGTPLYMAPEQARGEPIDFRADIYALGATLYQLVSGHPPFQAQTAAELRTMHESADRPALPRGVVPRMQSGSLDALIRKMMAPRPADRFASYDELLRAIELVSTQYTRPAGFFIRCVAQAADLIAIVFVLVLVHALLVGGGDVQMALYGMPLLAVYELLCIGRWGGTIGTALFELQVVALETGAKPGWRRATRRTLAMFGPLLVAGWSVRATEILGGPHLLRNILLLLYFIMMVTWGLHLLIASLRTAGKRTWWDRVAGTLIRYRR
jgi:protein kinase-like protein/RDD family protein